MTCLMPGATETEFFKRADMMDTDVGTTEKDDAAEAANARRLMCCRPAIWPARQNGQTRLREKMSCRAGNKESGKPALVITGASSGIGHATAKLAIAQNWRVFGSVRNEVDAEA